MYIIVLQITAYKIKPNLLDMIYESEFYLLHMLDIFLKTSVFFEHNFFTSSVWQYPLSA